MLRKQQQLYVQHLKNQFDINKIYGLNFDMNRAMLHYIWKR